MKLEWFREHQSKFFWITAILVIPGMMLFGSLDQFSSRGGGSQRGPSGYYFLPDGTRVEVGPEIIQQIRSEWYRFGAGIASSEEALHRTIREEAIKAMGIEVGPTEMIDVVRDDIKRRTQKELITEKDHKAVLINDSLGEDEYEGLNHRKTLFEKYLGNFSSNLDPNTYLLNQAKIPDNALYVTYCKEKQKTRIWYKSIRSRDFEGSVDKPKEEDISKLYEKDKELKASEPNSLYTKAKLDADIFYIPAEGVAVSMEPKPDIAKRFYDTNKSKFWKLANKDPNDKTETFKPFEDIEKEVKDKWLEAELQTEFDRYKTLWWKDKKFEEVKEDVQKRYQDNRRPTEASELFKKYEGELEEILAKAGHDEAEKTKALEQFAKDRKLKYWRTKKLTKEEFQKGKKELDAPDFNSAQVLFFQMEPGTNPEVDKNREKMRFKLSRSMPFNQLKDDYGFISTRVNSYDLERLMTKDEARGGLEQRLIEEAAQKKAREAAEALQKKWTEGKDLPKHGELVDESYTSGKEPFNPLAQAFFSKPKPLGEILDVAEEKDPAFKEDPNSYRNRYLVGFAVDLKVPTLNDFETDLEAKIGDRRRSLGFDRKFFLYREGSEYLVKMSRPRLTNETDPPLFGN